MTNFNYDRRTPFNVLTVEANFNLVQVGGKSLDALREDFYNQASGAFTRRPPAIVSAYDIALSGGEPYANWQ
jgi:hypothetical protein